MALVLKGSHSFTCTPRVHPLKKWTMAAFAFPAEAGTHLPTQDGWKAELALGGWLVTYRIGLELIPICRLSVRRWYRCAEEWRCGARCTTSNVNKKLSYRRDSARRRLLRRSRPFNVTDVSTNRKPVCDFLLMNNINYPISHRFPIIAQ